MLCCKYNFIVGDISNYTYLNRATLTNQRSLFLEKRSYYQKASLWKSRQHWVILFSTCTAFKDHMKKWSSPACMFSPSPDLQYLFTLWPAIYNSKHLLRFSHSSSEAWAELKRWISTEQGPFASGHSPKPASIQNVFGQHSWIFGLTFIFTCVESGVSFDDLSESLPTHSIPQWKCPCLWQEGWNWVIFEVTSNTKWFY